MANPTDEQKQAVRKALNDLATALAPYGMDVDYAPDIDINVRWHDVSSVNEARFIPWIEIDANQKAVLDFDGQYPRQS